MQIGHSSRQYSRKEKSVLHVKESAGKMVSKGRGLSAHEAVDKARKKYLRIVAGGNTR
jgi:hypothetical protein